MIAVLVGGPDRAVTAQERRPGAFLATETDCAAEQSVHEPLEADRDLQELASEPGHYPVDNRRADRGLDTAVGTVARAVLETLAAPDPGRWPWPIFTANIVGAFLLGHFTIRLLERLPVSRYRRPLSAPDCVEASRHSQPCTSPPRWCAASGWADDGRSLDRGRAARRCRGGAAVPRRPCRVRSPRPAVPDRHAGDQPQRRHAARLPSAAWR